MYKKILAFGASNSKNSINRKLAQFAASQIKNTEVTLVDLNDFEMPIYGIDKENANGIPPLAITFKQLIKDCDGIIISFAEHNGAYTSAFKKIFDWISRIEKDVWHNKPMFLLATSPGARGGKTVLDIASTKFRFMNQNTIVTFSLPSFNDNFNSKKGISNPELVSDFIKELNAFTNAL